MDFILLFEQEGCIYSRCSTIYALIITFYQLSMNNVLPVVTDISLTFVPRQNESKIRHITFQDHVNTVRDKFFDIHVQTRFL